MAHAKLRRGGHVHLYPVRELLLLFRRRVCEAADYSGGFGDTAGPIASAVILLSGATVSPEVSFRRSWRLPGPSDAYSTQQQG